MLVFEPDLIFSSRVENAASKSGLEAIVTITIDELQRAVWASVPEALLVNLDAFASTGWSLVESVRGRCRLIGYYSHVDSKLAAEALVRGFDEVVPRRTFVDKLSEILADLSSG